jgi:chromosome segregation ATPase
MAAQAELSAPPEPEPDEKVRTLMAELSAVEDELDAAADAARRGDAEASAVNLPALASRIAALQAELATAKQAAAEAEAEAERQKRQEQERQFNQAVEQARSDREEIRHLYRQLALALGSYCAAKERACDARNSLSTFLPDPWRDSQLSDVMNRAALDPKNELLDSGLKPVLGNLELVIPPLCGEKG